MTHSFPTRRPSDLAVDRIAGAPAGHAGPDGLHRAGHVDAEDVGQRMRGMRGAAGADLEVERIDAAGGDAHQHRAGAGFRPGGQGIAESAAMGVQHPGAHGLAAARRGAVGKGCDEAHDRSPGPRAGRSGWHGMTLGPIYRSEEHTSELQSLMRISYAVFCLKKKTQEDTFYTKSTLLLIILNH